MTQTYDIWTWPGWGAISAWASILALVTVFVAVWRFVRQRRQAPQFHLMWTILGTSRVNGDEYHLVEFVNAGRGFGYIDVLAVMNGHARLIEDHMAPRVLGSGQRFRLIITAPTVADVWLRTMTREPDDFVKMRFRWEPLVQGGNLWDQWVKEREAWGKRSPLQRWRDRYRPRPVAPHSQLAASVRAGKRANVSAVFGGERPAIMSNASAGTIFPNDLPYIGPAPTAPKP